MSYDPNRKEPPHWKEMREAMFMFYGGKYCTEGLFGKYRLAYRLGLHGGNIEVHHYVPLSKAEDDVEYYMINQPWNLIPCCAKHHRRMDSYARGDTGGYDHVEKRPKYKKVGYLRRLGWAIKRQWYKRKFDKRKGGRRIFGFWNYRQKKQNELFWEYQNWPYVCLGKENKRLENLFK